MIELHYCDICDRSEKDLLNQTLDSPLKLTGSGANAIGEFYLILLPTIVI